MTPRPRTAAPLLVSLVIISACAPPSQPAAPRSISKSNRTLVSGQQPHDTRRLAIVQAGPKGELSKTALPTLTFSKPMRALGTPAEKPELDATITPAIAGKWRWLGTTTAQFVPEAELPEATEFRVEVKPGATALDGERLAEGATFSFHTARPKLVASWPSNGANEIDLTAGITLELNHEVDTEQVLRHVRVLSSGTTLPTVIERTKDEREVVLKVKGTVPPSAKIEVELGEGLTGKRGPLTMGKTERLSFKTHGPASLESIGCVSTLEDGRCESTSRVAIRVSNWIPAGDIDAAVRITPAPKGRQRLEKGEREETTRELDLWADFEPGKSYRIDVTAPPARGKKQPSFVGALSTTVTFADKTPSVHFGFRGTYVPPDFSASIGLYATNTTSASVVAAPLDRDTLERLIRNRDKASEALATATGKVFELETPKKNEGTSKKVSMHDLTDGKRVPIALVGRYEGFLGKKTKVELLSPTRLGLTTKTSPEGVLVWVTDLTTAAPVDGVDVEVRSASGKRGTARTGSDGVAFVSAQALALPSLRSEETVHRRARFDTDERLVVFASIGGELTYTYGSPREPPALIGEMFTDRGLYRPGDTVRVKGFFRRTTSQGLAVPDAGQPVTIDVEDRASRHFTIETKLSAFGSFDATLPLPDDTSTGGLSIDARTAGGSARTWGRIEDYRPAEFAVEAALDKPTYRPDERPVCTSSARYYYGRPVTRRQAHYMVHRWATSMTLPGFEGWTNTPHSSHERDTHDFAELDRAGKATHKLAAAADTQEGPIRLICHVEVLDENRSEVTAEAHAIVHPAAVYAALAPRDRSVRLGEQLTVKAAAVTPEGSAQSRPVVISLDRVVRSREEKDPRPERRTVATCKAPPRQGPTGCALKAPSERLADDEQLILRAVVTDDNGRRSVAELPLWQDLGTRPPPPPPRPRSEPSTPPPPPSPSLSLSRTDEPAIGDPLLFHLAHVGAFKSALFTVEAEGVIAHKVLPLGGPTASIDLPSTTAMWGGTRAGVHLLAHESNGSFERRDLDHMLSLTSSRRALKVQVRPSTKEARPGDEIDIDVDVADEQGPTAGAEVTLWGADEGTLVLARYSTPHPEQLLERYREHLVDTDDTRNDMIKVGLFGSHRTKTPQVRMGATTVSPPRADFRQDVLWRPTLITDAQGRARARVRLPESLSQYRLMAVALAKADRFGSAESSLTTSKPLQARVQMPRVVRKGDRFELSAVVANLKREPVSIDVQVNARGLIVGNAKAPAEKVAPGDSIEVRVPLVAPQAGDYEVTARVSDGADDDAVKLTGQIEPAVMLQTTAIEGEVRDAIEESLGDLSQLSPDAGSLEVELSSTPLSTLGSSLRSLITYPYGCTEQTVSRLLPLLEARELATALGVPLTGPGAETVEASLRRLETHQQSNGGFGLWPRSQGASLFLTAYALLAFDEAARRGQGDHTRARDLARTYLRKALKEHPSSDTGWSFALDVLLSAASPETREVDATRLAPSEAPEAIDEKAFLLHALAISGHTGPLRDALVASLTAAITPRGAASIVPATARQSYLESDARTTALALRALGAHDPAHPSLPALVSGLLSLRRNGVFATTQESAWALVALAEHQRRLSSSGALHGEAHLGPALLATLSRSQGDVLRSERVVVPMADLQKSASGALLLSASGGAPMHYQVRLHSAPRALPTAPEDGSFVVRRTFHRLLSADGSKGAGWDRVADRIEPADMVGVELTVTTPITREAIVLVDPVPGGLEASLEGTYASYNYRNLGGSFDRKEVRDGKVIFFIDRMTAGTHTFRHQGRARFAGTYVVPPARVEAMYSPDESGHSGAVTFVIAP